MRRPTGKIVALFGLFLGLTIGLAVMLFKHWLINEIVSSIEDEVHAACDCSLAFDSFSLSFSTLSGRVRNARIIEHGSPRLSFREIKAKIDLSDIRDKKVILEKLILRDGTADGVGPRSVTFRFIDQLTTPLPPEKERPDRWRVILNSLEIRDSFLREPFGSSELSGSGVSLRVSREGENFALRPYIADLRYTSYGTSSDDPPTELFLGPLSGSILIEDARTLFRSLSLGRDDSNIALQGEMDTEHDNQCSGQASYELTPAYIGLPEWLKGSARGMASLSGKIESPILTGSLSSSPSRPLTLAFPYASTIPITSVSGDVVIDVNHGDPIVTLDSLVGKGGNASITSSAPLIFSDKGLSAGFSVSAGLFSYGPFAVQDATAQIAISQEDRGTHNSFTHTKFEISAHDLKLQGVSLGPAQLEIDLGPDSVAVAATSTDPLQGTLEWRGVIDVQSATPTLSSGTLKLDRFRYPTQVPIESGSLAPLEITSLLSFKGPLDMSKLNAVGETSVSFPALPDGMTLKGETTLKGGILKVALPNSRFGASADLTVDFVKTHGGALRVNLPTLQAREVFKETKCGQLGGALDYSFQSNAPLSGQGSLQIDTFQLGCAPYALQLPPKSTIPIKGGAMQLKNVTISSLNSALVLHGEIGIPKGFDVSAKGKLELSSLLPLFPSIDDLQGLLTTDLGIKGSISSPSFKGNAQLSGGQFGLSSPDLGAHSIQGSFSLSGNHIHIERLTGSANNGTFAMQGDLLPLDWPRSKLTASLQEVTIEPVQDASITFSGDLQLGLRDNKHQTLSGNLVINFAEVAKDLDLNKILLNAIAGYFLPARAQPTAAKQRVDIDLDIGITAPRNVFVLTPFFSAELNTQLHATGTVSEPTLEGSMQILSGWIGLKGNRFDITSGGLTFKPGTLMPTIEIASEGTLRAPTGENVLVILDISGPLQSPKIQVSSDRGLSQNELLLLLTSTRRLGGSTITNRFGSQFSADQRYFISEGSFSSLRAFFRNLTRIDTLSFEPAYNQFTGTIEPAVIARKNVSPRLTLLGESLFSSVSNSRAGGVYNLTPSLNVNAFFQTVSTQKNSILSSDLTYTILSEQTQFVTFAIEGLREFDEESILASARLGTASRILNNEEGLQSISRQILNYMNDQGYREATVSVECRRGERYCYEIAMRISEGAPSKIHDILFEGDTLPDELLQAARSLAPINTTATTTLLNAIERKLVLALRNEGYIAARITPHYRPADTAHAVHLAVTSDIREPISFIFTGNTVFSAENFLDSIDLFTRKRPFGNNTIKLLVQNIEHMYQERGYLFVQVSYTEDRSNPARLVYAITINEESPTHVHSLRLRGNDHLSQDRIIEVMSELGLTDQIRLFKPKHAVADQLDTLRDAIQTVYQQEGFARASVSYVIIPSKRGDELDVEFVITEGEPERALIVETGGFPAHLQSPPLPTTPTSLPRVNKFIDDCIEKLKGEGFLFPAATVEPSEDTTTLTISFEPGSVTNVSAILFEGLATITEDTAARETTLKIGSPLRAEDINTTKRNLLRSGLFSRVEILPQDGSFDSPSEAVVIRLVERPLQTLEVGAGANSEFGLHTFGEAVNKSLFADGRTLSLRVDTYFDQANINPGGSGTISQGFTSARYVDPSFLDSDYTLTEEARYQRQELSTQEFNLDRVLIGSYLFRQYVPDFTLSAGHSLLFDNLQDVTPDAIISDLDEGSVRLSFLSSVMKLDRRDDPLLPRSGYTLSLEPKVSMGAIGSQANFASAIARSTAVVPLRFVSPRYSLGFGLSGGISQPWGSTDVVPITQRFYLGGRTTVRGFRENSLGPRGVDGAVIGGDTFLAGKSQFQYLVADSFSTHLFFDVGNVFLRHRNSPLFDEQTRAGFDLSDLRTSIGAGFQYLSPIGPIGFDVGHPLDEKGGEPSVRIHFSVGSMF